MDEEIRGAAEIGVTTAPSQIYINLQFNSIQTVNVNTEFIPLTVGYRW